MALNPLPPARRIVTGVDADGRSCIAEDGGSPAMHGAEARTGFRSNNVWRTRADGGVDAPDTILDHATLAPPKGGTVLRVIDIPPDPDDVEAHRAAMRTAFATLYRDAHHDPDHPRHPGMHTTDTIDYAIVLQGELVAVMEAGETTMRAGDILVQRGTAHAWANRSGQIARIAFVLVDARRA